MKRLKVFLLLTMLMLSSTYANAVSLDSISPCKLLRYAKRVRYGINTDVNLERAAKIYNYLAKKGNTDAQRELGCMFLNGEGVSQNLSSAYYLLNQASRANDTKAMCVMADVYLRGICGRTNKKLAFKLYSRAAQLGNAQGFYGAGNMLYKGIGTKQDYQQAEKLLLQGSEKGNAKCDFLLANYYAYGFGGTPDYAKAKEYLNKAVKNGHGWTVDMTLFSKLDSIVKQNKTVKAKSALAKSSRKIDKKKVQNSSDILGSWKGTLNIYDWSKTRVLKEEPIKIQVSEDTCLVVTFLQNDSVITVFRSEKQTDNKWSNHMISGDAFKYSWVPTSLTFETSLNNNILYASMTRLNGNRRSVLKPIKLTLQREGNTTSINNLLLNENICVSPLPIKDNFVVILNINSSTSVNLTIFNIAGMKVEDLGRHELRAGENHLFLHSSLPHGEYILRLSGNGISKSLKIIHL